MISAIHPIADGSIRTLALETGTLDRCGQRITINTSLLGLRL